MTETNLTWIAHLAHGYYCGACNVSHASGYRCASQRKLDRSVARYGRFATPTVALAKGTK